MLKVSIILGSESDLPVFEESKATEVLEKCEVPWALSVISADRNPGQLTGYCDQLRAQGAEVIVAGAGMAARLPATIAAHMKYHTPIIGVAVPSAEFSDALDALLSITRTPSGCPVLFAGIGKAGFRNAAISAVQILSNGESEERKKIRKNLTNYLSRAGKGPQIEFRNSPKESPVKYFMGLGEGWTHRGKVRDTYDLGNDKLLIVATDRISAFDVVLPNGVPSKGFVLNNLSAFWFELTRIIIPNHLVRVIDDITTLPGNFPSLFNGRSMVVRKAERIDVECVVRGYITGLAWVEYQKSGSICGIELPPGLIESQELPEPIFTPTTKSKTGHDKPLTFQGIEKLVSDVALAEEMKAKSLEVYSHAREYAQKKGIIIADTKFEFGIIDGELSLIDELLTPDSSRFWDAVDYEPGRAQKSLDKQPVRDWLADSDWNKEPPAPRLPEDVVSATTKRYREVYARLTDRSLD